MGALQGRPRSVTQASIDLDAATIRALEHHEMSAQAGASRTVRDLGDALLLSDPLDADPFLNRAGAIRFPSSPRAFDTRLDELIVLFATLGRTPHVRSSPLHHAPADLPARLRANGFALVGETRMMVMGHAAPRPGALPGGMRLRRLAGLTGTRARRAAGDVATVLAAAFDVEASGSLAVDLAAWLADPRVMLYLVESDAGPLAVAKRHTQAGWSYVSSVGTVPAWQGRGLATAALAAATDDALAAGGARVHLAVDRRSQGAARLYTRLGYVPVGAPAGHYLAT